MKKYAVYVLAMIIAMLVLFGVFLYIKRGYDAYVFGLPIVMNYAVLTSYVLNKNSGEYKAPFNVINNQRNVYTYKDTAIITPNSDTPYSMVWLDLRNEPVVISVPEIKDRYYSIQMVDGSTYNYGYIGTRATGTSAGSYMIGFGMPRVIPQDIRKTFVSNSPLSLVIIRTQLKGPEDLQNVINIQNKYKIQTLSEFRGTPSSTNLKTEEMPQVTNEDVEKDFMGSLNKAIQFIPEDKYSKDMFFMLGQIGVGPRKSHEYSRNSALIKFLIQRGIDWAKKDVANAVKNAPKKNGWAFLSAYGNVDDYAGDWMKRALVAKGGIYANDADEAVYPLTYVDACGRQLNGNRKYEIAMKLTDLPPSKAFWSITMYDAKTQLLIKNPINRYLINSEMLSSMKTSNGTVKFYISYKNPGKELESNWLPAPDGNFYIVMRIYYPDQKKIKTWSSPLICTRN